MNNELNDWLSEFKDLNPDEHSDVTLDKKYKLDLFSQILPAIDRKDIHYFSKLSKEEQDSIEPWILMRWLTSAEFDKDQPLFLLLVNELVNNNFSCLTPKKASGIMGHKELLWMLMALCGTGKSVRRKFIKPGKGIVKNKLEEAILSFFPLIKDSDLELLLSINSKEDFILFFKENGYDDKYIQDIF